MHTVVLIIDSTALHRFGGLSLWSRLTRTLRGQGATSIHVIAGEALHKKMTMPVGPRDQVDAISWIEGSRVTTEAVLATFPTTASAALIVPGDRLIDPRILQVMVQRPPCLSVVDSASGRATHRCGPVLVDRLWLDNHSGDLDEQVARGLADGTLPALDVDQLPVYARSLRRELRPFCLPTPTGSGRREAKHALLEATQKGALDLPAIAHAPIEKFLAWSLAETPITPNQITVATNVIAWSATYLLLVGQLGWGLALALAVGILDGVDGKLARLRLETSRLGELEHWADFVYEWSWWAALAYHLSSSGLLPGAWQSFAFLALAEIVDGAAKLINLRTFGCTIDEMGSFDRKVRLVGGRRNIYVWLLAAGALVGQTAATFALLPWLQGATAIVHWLRIGWLLRHRPRSATQTTTGEMG